MCDDFGNQNRSIIRLPSTNQDCSGLTSFQVVLQDTVTLDDNPADCPRAGGSASRSFNRPSHSDFAEKTQAICDQALNDLNQSSLGGMSRKRSNCPSNMQFSVKFKDPNSPSAQSQGEAGFTGSGGVGGSRTGMARQMSGGGGSGGGGRGYRASPDGGGYGGMNPDCGPGGGGYGAGMGRGGYGGGPPGAGYAVMGNSYPGSGGGYQGGAGGMGGVPGAMGGGSGAMGGGPGPMGGGSGGGVYDDIHCPPCREYDGQATGPGPFGSGALGGLGGSRGVADRDAMCAELDRLCGQGGGGRGPMYTSPSGVGGSPPRPGQFSPPPGMGGTFGSGALAGIGGGAGGMGGSGLGTGVYDGMGPGVYGSGTGGGFGSGGMGGGASGMGGGALSGMGSGMVGGTGSGMGVAMPGMGRVTSGVGARPSVSGAPVPGAENCGYGPFPDLEALCAAAAAGKAAPAAGAPGKN